jgi:hypothetical protein
MLYYTIRVERGDFRVVFSRSRLLKDETRLNPV